MTQKAQSGAAERCAVEKDKLLGTVELLRSVRAELTDLMMIVNDGGENAAIQQIGPRVQDLQKSLRMVLEAEQRYDEWCDKSGTGGSAAGIDFDAMRAELGCRLNRIRACCHSGGFSG